MEETCVDPCRRVQMEVLSKGLHLKTKIQDFIKGEVYIKYSVRRNGILIITFIVIVNDTQLTKNTQFVTWM